MSLIQLTAKFIEKHRLLSPEDRILVATSGGVDSMTMLHVLYALNYQVAVAHINYTLRGADSNQDQTLVEKYCKNLNVPLFNYTVTSEEILALQNENLQSVARTIRYTFFQKIKTAKGYDVIATAHHKNDQIETFFLNLIRGSGTTGLRSIKPKRGDIVRPFLEFTKEDIYTFSKEHEIPYREDRSNSKDHYDRNYLRNQVIPRFENRWTNFANRIHRTIINVQNENQILNYLLEKESENWVSKDKDNWKIGPMSQLIAMPGSETLMNFIGQPFGLRPDQIFSILNKKTAVGADFSNEVYHIILDRNYLIISLRISELLYQKIHHPSTYPTQLGKLVIEETRHAVFANGSEYEVMDRAKVNFPLQLRSWEKGDRWQPLGLNGHQLVSDTFINNKIDRIRKERTAILEDARGEIIYIHGIGISEIVKIEKQSQEYLKVSFS